MTHAQVVELITAGRSGDLGAAAERPTARPTATPSNGATHDHVDGAAGPSRRPPAPRPIAAARTSGRTSRRVRGGDMGALPAVLGLVVLCVVFSIARPVFFTAGNFANLLPQGAAVTVIAMGLVFVLLLGEIDLSAGFTSGVCAAVLAIAADRRTAAVVRGDRSPRSSPASSSASTSACWWRRSASRPSWSRSPRSWPSRASVLLLIKGGTIISIRDPTILAIDNEQPAAGCSAGSCSPSPSLALRRACSCCSAAAGAGRGLAVEPMSRRSRCGSARLAVLARRRASTCSTSSAAATPRSSR